ncbi:MAG TPA: hypothetical protein VFU06_05670 [Longimicrobiales bacterium]|nr:hypothetical protein [Longimicrobiales bacterium]
MTRIMLRATPLLALLALGACAGADAPDASADRNAAAGLSADADGAEYFESSGAVWEAARRRGVRFRAVGQEPGWVVELYPRERMHVLADYGALEFDSPWAEPVRDEEEDSVVYTTSTPEHTVRMTVTEVPCTDTMSGEGFTHAIVLELDERVLYGCGRSLE